MPVLVMNYLICNVSLKLTFPHHNRAEKYSDGKTRKSEFAKKATFSSSSWTECC